MTFSNRLVEKLNRLRTHFAHSNPSMNYEQLIERFADDAIADIERVPQKRRSNIDKNQESMPVESQPGSQLHAHEAALQDRELHAHEVKSDPHKKSQKRSRNIPAAVRREVIFNERDCGCEYVDQQTGQRCGSKFFLQLDHRLPFSFGGKHVAENLRLFCGAHNRFVYGEILRRQNLRFSGLAPTR